MICFRTNCYRSVCVFFSFFRLCKQQQLQLTYKTMCVYVCIERRKKVKCRRSAIIDFISLSLSFLDMCAFVCTEFLTIKAVDSKCAIKVQKLPKATNNTHIYKFKCTNIQQQQPSHEEEKE